MTDKPFLGVAYYPEDWPDSEMERDIAKMKETGIKCARIAEFAWHKMEPKPGEYHFEWLHTVVNKLAEAGIKTVMCTPSATPPIWLSDAHPDIFVLKKDGNRFRHGGRRHCCSNNPHYRKANRDIVRKMGETFGQDQSIIGWQIDNELDFQYCRCPYCLDGFHQMLKEKYGTIEQLNAAWNLNLFSQAYDRFDQIPFPDHNWHNPHLELEALLFDSQSQVEMVKEQADILRAYTKAPIGTDGKPYQRVDYEQLEKSLDIVQFNHYHTAENLNEAMMWMDLMRTLSPRPFWNTETATTWNGATVIGQSIKPDGFCRVNSLLPIFLGGEANMYWLWRTHHAGHELTHGALLYPSGRPYPTHYEVVQAAQDLEKWGDFLKDTKVVSEVAVHFTSLGWNMMTTQPLVEGGDYRSRVFDYAYRPLLHSGLRPSAITAGESLSPYKLLFTPFLLSLEEGDLPERICRFAEEGGVWVVGPMTDMRNHCGARYTDRAYGILEDLTGIKQVYEVPDSQKQIKCRWTDGEEAFAGSWYECFEADRKDTLVYIAEGYSALQGKAVAVRKQVGKGAVYLIGSCLEEPDMKKIIAMACRDAGVTPYDITGDLIVAPRKGKESEGLCVAECMNRSASITLPCPMTDLLSGETKSGKVSLSPYEVLVLQKPSI